MECVHGLADSCDMRHVKVVAKPPYCSARVPPCKESTLFRVLATEAKDSLAFSGIEQILHSIYLLPDFVFVTLRCLGVYRCMGAVSANYSGPTRPSHQVLRLILLVVAKWKAIDVRLCKLTSSSSLDQPDRPRTAAVQTMTYMANEAEMVLACHAEPIFISHGLCL